MITPAELARMKNRAKATGLIRSVVEEDALRLIAEVEALRAALRGVITEYDEYVGEADTEAIAKARAALGETVT